MTADCSVAGRTPIVIAATVNPIDAFPPRSRYTNEAENKFDLFDTTCNSGRCCDMTRRCYRRFRNGLDVAKLREH
jgi:hypothetical protein